MNDLDDQLEVAGIVVGTAFAITLIICDQIAMRYLSHFWAALGAVCFSLQMRIYQSEKDMRRRVPLARLL